MKPKVLFSVCFPTVIVTAIDSFFPFDVFGTVKVQIAETGFARAVVFTGDLPTFDTQRTVLGAVFVLLLRFARIVSVNRVPALGGPAAGVAEMPVAFVAGGGGGGGGGGGAVPIR